MFKIKCFLDKGREEDYINYMVSQGYALKQIKCFKNSVIPAGIYEFEKCEPDEYVYRIDYQTDMTKSQVKEHISKIEKTGAELISERQCILVFRKKTDFAFKYDEETVKKYYNRLKTVYMTFFVAVIAMLGAEGYMLKQDPGNTPVWMAVIITIIHSTTKCDIPR